MANCWYDQIGGLSLVLNCDFDERILHYFVLKLPMFYCEILLAWYKVKGYTVKKCLIENLMV